MCRIEDDRRQFPHAWNGRHVVDQAVVAEERAALRQHEVAAAAFAQFGGDVGHFLRRHELAFFHIHAASGRGGREQQVGLSAEEGGNLHAVEHLSTRRGLFGQMNVGNDGQVEFPFYLGENRQPRFDARSAKAAAAGAVRFVETGFEDIGQLARDADFLNGLGQKEGVVARFDDAGAGNECERRSAADANASDGCGLWLRHGIKAPVDAW